MKQLLLAFTMAVFVSTAACGGTDSSPTTSSGTATPENGLSNITSLQVTNVKVGDGAEAVAGRTVVVHYTGWLWSQSAAGNRGTKFDSSRDRNEPFPFPLGAGRVIAGWDQGVAGMKVGGQRTLVIPPSLGYGSQGFPPVIPPNSTLVFDVELLEVR
jgi:FKBP-type peptidyl-prolyl cis-trans isomerase FkpA